MASPGGGRRDLRNHPAGSPRGASEPRSAPGGALKQLAEEGLASLAEESFEEAFERLGPPIVAPSEVLSPSERLAELRRGER